MLVLCINQDEAKTLVQHFHFRDNIRDTSPPPPAHIFITQIAYPQSDNIVWYNMPRQDTNWLCA